MLLILSPGLAQMTECPACPVKSLPGAPVPVQNVQEGPSVPILQKQRPSRLVSAAFVLLTIPGFNVIGCN